MAIDDRVDILTWNVMNAASDKSRDPEAMKVIYGVLTHRPYDLIFLQEIEGMSFIRKLDDMFQAATSPVPYRTRPNYSGVEPYAENYVCFYNSDTVQAVSNMVYPDETGQFFRPPQIVYASLRNGWEGVFVNMHTSPKVIRDRQGKVVKDYAKDETRALEEVVDYAKWRYGTQNAIIVGDLNFWPPYFSRSKKQPFTMKSPRDYPGTMIDTTINRDLRPLDHIIYDASQADLANAKVDKFDVAMWRRVLKVFDERQWYDAMRDISDHWPVYAQFHARHLSEYRLSRPLVWLGRAALRKINGVKTQKVKG